MGYGKESVIESATECRDPQYSWTTGNALGAKEHHRFESPRAGAEDVGDLSGFVDQLTCVSPGKESTVAPSA
jgi:hypothetical protein